MQALPAYCICSTRVQQYAIGPAGRYTHIELRKKEGEQIETTKTNFHRLYRYIHAPVNRYTDHTGIARYPPLLQLLSHPPCLPLSLQPPSPPSALPPPPSVSPLLAPSAAAARKVRGSWIAAAAAEEGLKLGGCSAAKG